METLTLSIEGCRALAEQDAEIERMEQDECRCAAIVDADSAVVAIMVDDECHAHGVVVAS